MQSDLAQFLDYYEAAHRNANNRYIHHLAHMLGVVGILMLWRPLFGLLIIAASFGLSWTGHYLFERNTPAFFAAADRKGLGAAFATKVQVALGGLIWSFACFLRLFNRGPLVG